MLIITLSIWLFISLCLIIIHWRENKQLRYELEEKNEQILMLIEIMQDPQKLADYNKFVAETFAVIEEARIKYGAEYVVDVRHGASRIMLALIEYNHVK
jgi:hypothetical protein